MIFYVNDMSCSHCKATIESILIKEKGIKKYKVDIENKTVDVEGSFDKDTVFKKIVNAGFTPTI